MLARSLALSPSLHPSPRCPAVHSNIHRRPQQRNKLCAPKQRWSSTVSGKRASVTGTAWVHTVVVPFTLHWPFSHSMPLIPSASSSFAFLLCRRSGRRCRWVSISASRASSVWSRPTNYLFLLLLLCAAYLIFNLLSFIIIHSSDAFDIFALHLEFTNWLLFLFAVSYPFVRHGLGLHNVPENDQRFRFKWNSSRESHCKFVENYVGWHRLASVGGAVWPSLPFASLAPNSLRTAIATNTQYLVCANNNNNNDCCNSQCPLLASN